MAPNSQVVHDGEKHRPTTQQQRQQPSSENEVSTQEKLCSHLLTGEDSVQADIRDEFLKVGDNYSLNGDVEDSTSSSFPAASPPDFLRHFIGASGPPQIIGLCVLVALALGSTVGVVPAVMEDRYARLNHGYDGDARCLDVPQVDRPGECLSGNEDAQNAAAASGFVNNVLTFATSSLMGSISDERGRKGIMILGIGLSLLAPLSLVLLQVFETMNPSYYYASHAASGVVSWMAVALSSLSDVMPPEWRAPSFGLVIAGFSAGFALSPILAILLSHFGVSVFALALLVFGFIFACVFMPETLPLETSKQARLKRLADIPASETHVQTLVRNLMRPATELFILNRNTLFRLLSALAFFSGIVGSADQTLFLYYVEENFGFNDKDIAVLFLIIGLTGILVQGIVLKPLNAQIGERLVIVVAFSVGAIQNFLYGTAKSKRTIFIAATIACFQGMSFPTISAIKSNNVDESEQGRIQGALYSLTSLASAVGPLTLRYVYHKTKDGGGFGKGTMFIFGAGLYLVATAFAWMLPKDKANSSSSGIRREREGAKKRTSLTEPETRKQKPAASYGSADDTNA